MADMCSEALELGSMVLGVEDEVGGFEVMLMIDWYL
jgi:hypothetical protein